METELNGSALTICLEIHLLINFGPSGLYEDFDQVTRLPLEQALM